MRVTAVADGLGGALDASVPPGLVPSFIDLIGCVSPEFGPVLRASSFVGFGESGGGGYAGHAELLDMDGLLRDLYGQPSMQPGVNDTLFGGGKGARLPDATKATIGEAVERVVAALTACSPLIPSERVVADHDGMTTRGLPALHPDQVRLFSAEQYALPGFLYEPFTTGTAVQWVRGRRLRSGEEIWVPAQLVDMVHIYDPGEVIIGYPVSGGLSCHTATTDAIYHGLTEVIERDAVNVSWYTPNPPRRLVVDDAARRLIGPFLTRLAHDHSEWYVLNHVSGVCAAPTFSVVGFQRWWSSRQYCAGGGCDVVPSAALRKAANEFGQTRSTLTIANMAPGSSVGRSVRTMFDWQVGRPLSEMELFFQAIGYYGLDEYLPLLEPYLSGPDLTAEEILTRADGLTDASAVPDRLHALLDELGGHGIDPIWLDYSHPDWRRLSVVKVFVPELSTPFLQSRPMLGHPRLTPLRPEIRLPNARVAPLPYP